MKCTIQSPSYLVRNVHSYCFRLIVPPDLRKFVGRGELRYSLKTGYIGIAKQKSRFVAGQVQLIFRLLRKGFSWMGKLSEDQIQQLVGKYVKESIEGWDKAFEPGRDEESMRYEDPRAFYSHVNELASIREDLIIELNKGNYSMLEDPIRILLKKNEVEEVDKQSPAYRKLCIEIHKAETRLLPIQQQHMQCDFSYKDQLPKLFPEVFATKDQNPPTPPSSPQDGQLPTPREEVPQKQKQKPVKLQMVFNEYWKEKEPALKGRSSTEVKRALDHFLCIVGKNTDIHCIDAEVLRGYKKKLIDEEIAPGKKRSTKTINDKYLTFVKGFLKYCKQHSYLYENPAEGLLIKERRDRRPDEERDPFTITDLRKIFCESLEYAQDQMDFPHRFWIPLIGLYTGMRIEEICQLYVSDLKLIDGIWCLDINQDKPDKSVKTSERRIVPLHPFLVNDLNFVGYVQNIPQDGRIFPELKRIADRYSHHASPWFSKFKERCGIVARSGNKTFHSFRHTVTDHLFKRDVQERVISMLVGHALKGETGGRYGKRYEPKLLYEKTVLKLNYKLDLSHLKSSRWVVQK
jgi:integrase